MWIFFKFFTIDPNYEFHHIPVADLLPFLKKDLTNLMLSNELQAQSILEWMSNATHYINGDSDDLPQVEFGNVKV